MTAATAFAILLLASLVYLAGVLPRVNLLRVTDRAEREDIVPTTDLEPAEAVRVAVVALLVAVLVKAVTDALTRVGMVLVLALVLGFYAVGLLLGFAALTTDNAALMWSASLYLLVSVLAALVALGFWLLRVASAVMAGKVKDSPS